MISVIVPAYNASNYIEKCLDSLLTQTHKDLEIIVINDGSADNTAEIINSYNDDRIKFINQENQGQSAARNKGLEIAHGDYISFIDSDDYVELDYFEKLHSEALKTDADIVMAQTKIIDGKNVKILENDNSLETDFIQKYKLLHNGGPCDKIYKTDLIIKNNLKFCVGRMYEDLLFCTQAVYYSDKMATINNTNYNYIIYPHSTSHSPDREKKRQDDSLFIAQKIKEFFAQQHISHEYQNEIIPFIKQVLTPPEQSNNASYLFKMKKIFE